jgi:hypothetical protein
MDLPPVGPWWFVPFIVQWYCLWPLIRRFAIRFGAPGLFALAGGALAFTAIANGPLARWNVNLLETPIGHMPELCLGILAARYPVRISWAALLTAGATFLAALFVQVWLLSFPSALILMIGSMPSRAYFAKTPARAHRRVLDGGLSPEWDRKTPSSMQCLIGSSQLPCWRRLSASRAISLAVCQAKPAVQAMSAGPA